MAKKDVRIVVLQRGWVYIGNFSKAAGECVLKNASCGEDAQHVGSSDVARKDGDGYGDGW